MIIHGLRYALYAGIVAAILTLSGVFVSFESREVISGVSLSIVTLILMIGAGAYAAGSHARGHGAAPMWAAAVLGGLVVGALLAALVVIEANIDLRFVFANLTKPIGATLTFGQEMAPGLLYLLGISAAIGAVAAALLTLAAGWRRVIMLGVGLTAVLGLLESQLAAIITLPDALVLAFAFALGYAAATLVKGQSWIITLLIAAVPGLVVGVVLGVLANGGGLAAGGILRGSGSVPVILAVAAGNASVPLAIILGIIALIGGLSSGASGIFHNSGLFFIVTLLVIGTINAQNGMTVLAVWNGERVIRTGLADLKLAFGDALLLQGPRERLPMLRLSSDLIVLSAEEGAVKKVSQKAPLALGIFALSVAVAASGIFSVGEVMLTGALLMVILNVLTMEQAYRVIERRIIFLVAGMLQ